MMKFLITAPYKFHIKKWNPNETPQIKESCRIPATLDNIGDSGRTRTPNLLIRSQLLYPVELRNHNCAVLPDLTDLVQFYP